MIVTLGDTLILVGMLVLALCVGQLLLGLRQINIILHMLLAANGFREAGINEFRVVIGEAPETRDEA